MSTERFDIEKLERLVRLANLSGTFYFAKKRTVKIKSHILSCTRLEGIEANLLFNIYGHTTKN